MKTFFVATAVFATAAAAAPALAQDTDSNPVFTGPRIELHGGWERDSVHARVDDGVTTSRGSAHSSDGFFGGQVGYDYAIRQGTTIGAFASYDLSNVERCAFADGGSSACLKAAATSRRVAVSAKSSAAALWFMPRVPTSTHAPG